MTFHKEGYPSLIITILFIAIVKYLSHLFIEINAIRILIDVFLVFLLVIIIQFFRSPAREGKINENHILSPADGKVVAIEEIEETEYFKDKRIQVSVFMSPINVHINWFPISGLVSYEKYHPGKYLVAWHPKSSTENERTTVVVKHDNGQEVLLRQIAGALARRIVNYAKKDHTAIQGEQFGFIKFGSRVDIILPLGTKINVKLNQKVKGKQSVIASFL